MIKLKRSIALLVCFMLLLLELTPVMAAENTGGFRISGTVLYGYDGTDSVVTIPDGVTEFRAEIYGNTTMTKLIIPEGVTVIDDFAVRNCTNLTEIVLPSTLKEIGDFAFEDNPKLTTVNLPEGLTSVGHCLFRRCTALQSITWPSTATEIPGEAFSECSALTSVTIPEGVTKIGDSAFSESGISTIKLPQSLTTLSYNCFGNSAITSITLPSKVTEVAEYAFDECTKLKSVTIEGAVHTIHEWAFFGCTSLTSFPTLQSLTTVENHAFCQTGLKEITLLNLQSLGREAFGNASLEKVTIGGTLTTIPEHCFQACKALKTVVLPNSIKRIEKQAFHACEVLSSINMPTSLEYIGENSFSHTALQEVSFSNTLTTIEFMAFSSCKSLKKLSLPGNVTNLSNAFMDHHTNTVIEAPQGSVTYNSLVNAGFIVVVMGGTTPNGGNSSNGDNPSNNDNSGQENTTPKDEPSNSEDVDTDEKLVKEVLEKIEAAEEGTNVVLQVGTLDKQVLEALKGKDVELTLELGTYSWVIDGKTLSDNEFSTIDMRVTLDSNAIAASVVEELAKDAPTKQISLAHNGEFGFSAELHINLGSEYAGQIGNLYYYNSEGKLEFQTASEIKSDGTIPLTFEHASDYVIVITEDKQVSNETDTELDDMTENEDSQTTEEQSGEQKDNEKDKGSSGKMILIVCLVLLVIGGIAGGLYWYLKIYKK